MEKKKIAGIILLVVGIVFVVLALIIDLIGIGQTPGFGQNQIVGTVVGVLLALVGIIMLCIPQKKERNE